METNGAEPAVPVIDFAGLGGDQREAIAQQVARACEEWGFFQVVNHGVDPGIIKRVKEVSRRVFDLPIEEKQQIKYDVTMFQGWIHSSLKKVETANSDVKVETSDMNECFLLTHFPVSDRMEKQYPVGVPDYRTTVLEYVEETKVLFFKVFKLLLEQLGLPDETLKRLLVEPRIATNTNLYPKPVEGVQANGRINAHSDKGYMTLLLSDEVSGLEIKKDGKWLRVDPLPGAFIVNVADTTEILSNGRYVSVEHRGTGNPEMERMSLAEFFTPQFHVEIGPLKEVVSINNPPRYKTYIFGDYFTSFYQRRFGRQDRWLQTAEIGWEKM